VLVVLVLYGAAVLAYAFWGVVAGVIGACAYYVAMWFPARQVATLVKATRERRASMASPHDERPDPRDEGRGVRGTGEQSHQRR